MHSPPHHSLFPVTLNLPPRSVSPLSRLSVPSDLALAKLQNCERSVARHDDRDGKIVHWVTLGALRKITQIQLTSYYYYVLYLPCLRVQNLLRSTTTQRPVAPHLAKRTHFRGKPDMISRMIFRLQNAKLFEQPFGIPTKSEPMIQASMCNGDLGEC